MIELKKEESEESLILNKIIQRGSEIVGNVGLGLVGGILGGFPGIVAGAAYGSVLAELLKNASLQVKDWAMGDRQEVRVGATYVYGAMHIQHLLEQGLAIRSDNFFKATNNNRSAADEILEGTLLRSQNEYEELKLRHYGYFLANISFRVDIDRARANFFLRTAERLSFRQFCLIQILDNRDKFTLNTSKPEFIDYHAGNQVNTYADLKNRAKEVNLLPSTVKTRNSFLTSRLHFPQEDLVADMNELVQLNFFDKAPDMSTGYDQIKITRIGELFRELFILDKLDESETGPLSSFLTYRES